MCQDHICLFAQKYFVWMPLTTKLNKAYFRRLAESLYLQNLHFAANKNSFLNIIKHCQRWQALLNNLSLAKNLQNPHSEPNILWLIVLYLFIIYFLALFFM